MKRKSFTAKYAEKKRSGTISSPGVSEQVKLSNQAADVIAQRIGSHYVVTIMRKPMPKEGDISLFFTHFNACFSVLMNIMKEDLGGKPNVLGKDNKL